MVGLLVLAFVVVPLVELYVIVQVSHVVGVLPTIGLLLLVSFVGAWLVRREGARAWGSFRAALAEGRVPARETADGALVIVGGALLLAPGFVTDVIGALCVLPPTRALVRRALTRVAARRTGVAGWMARPPGGGDGVRRVRSRRGPAMPDRRPANAPPADRRDPPAPAADPTPD